MPYNSPFFCHHAYRCKSQGHYDGYQVSMQCNKCFTEIPDSVGECTGQGHGAHILFEVWSADTVAECLEGVTDDLYRRLWELTTGMPLPNEVNDNFPDYCLARSWEKLTAEEQTFLNDLAEKHEKSLG